MFGFSRNRRSSKKSSRNSHTSRRRMTFEGLEQRTMFAVSAEIVDNQLVITGSDEMYHTGVVVTKERDKIVVHDITIDPGGTYEKTQQFNANEVKRILFYGTGEDDRFKNETALGVWADLGDGNDRFHGGRAKDVVLGGDGIDWIYGHGGNDIIDGVKRDNDYIFGGTGIDVLFGGADNDWVEGEENRDAVFGGSGADKVFGDSGSDIVDGGEDGTRDLIGGRRPFHTEWRQ